MTTVNVYLTFNGNCMEAFDFYKSIFGGDYANVSHYKDMPAGQESQVDKEDGDKIMHIALPVSQETMLMGSDTGGQWASSFYPGNNFSLSISTDSKEKADHLFNGLSTGGMITMPINKTFWGDYFGMFTDKFGINWMVSFNENPLHK